MRFPPAAPRKPQLLGCDLTIAQALADATRWCQAQAAAGARSSRGGWAEQVGMYQMAAGTLGLTEQVASITGPAGGGLACP